MDTMYRVVARGVYAVGGRALSVGVTTLAEQIEDFDAALEARLIEPAPQPVEHVAEPGSYTPQQVAEIRRAYDARIADLQSRVDELEAEVEDLLSDDEGEVEAEAEGGDEGGGGDEGDKSSPVATGPAKGRKR